MSFIKKDKKIIIENSPPQSLCNEVDTFNNTREKAKKYHQAGIQNTYYLGYRDLPQILKSYNVKKKTIDYGCGTGRSTRFLRSLGFETIGVDTSEEMLKQAISNDEDNSHYCLIKSAHIPVLENSYDLFFSCFVFLTIPDFNELFSIFKEAYRCLKPGGHFVFVTGSENLYSYEWLSYNINYPENKKLRSGGLARIQLKDLDIEFINYYWQYSDYENLANSSNFQILERYYPLGKPTDQQNWVNESTHSPYVIYIMQKR